MKKISEIKNTLNANNFYEMEDNSFISNDNSYNIVVNEEEIVLIDEKGNTSFHPLDIFTIVGILFHIKKQSTNFINYTI